ncbi:MAG: polyprenyl synthetase family protein [Bacteroidales bacterium]|nr:polyprenyl synthetase family protein [Bacteroidales bacterium]
MTTFEQALETVTKEYGRRVDNDPTALLQQVGHHLAELHGKMLRPKLVLLATATANEADIAAPRTILLATATEMLHNASLLHDDVVDDSPYRRGQPSANSQWGNRTAILAGDFFLAQIMLLMEEVGDRQATRKMAETVADMTRGELIQMQCQNSAPNRDTYATITRCKTASLMATCCYYGNPTLETFGLHYGMAFQLRDDIDDNEATPFTAEMLDTEVSLAIAELDKIKSSPFVQELRSMTNKLINK